MANSDKLSGKIKQGRGKMNEVTGAITGNLGQEIKGKVQKTIGKAQEKYGEAKEDKRENPRR